MNNASEGDKNRARQISKFLTFSPAESNLCSDFKSSLPNLSNSRRAAVYFNSKRQPRVSLPRKIFSISEMMSERETEREREREEREEREGERERERERAGRYENGDEMQRG